MVANTLFKLSRYVLGLVFILTNLKASTEHDCKHVLRLLRRLYGDQALEYEMKIVQIE